MSTIRLMSLENVVIMGAAIYVIITSASCLSHVRFHSYCTWLLHRDVTKGRGWMRSTEPTMYIGTMRMTRDKPILQQLDKFRVSLENKRNLHMLFRYIMETTSILSSSPDMLCRLVNCFQQVKLGYLKTQKCLSLMAVPFINCPQKNYPTTCNEPVEHVHKCDCAEYY